jgi:hypothetical protein
MLIFTSLTPCNNSLLRVHTLLLLLQDLGYTVDFSKADPLTETSSLREARQQKEAAIIAAGETPFSAKTEVLRLHDDILQRPVREHIQRRFR